MKKRLLTILCLLTTALSSFAQFYDSEDRILFYQCILLNWEVNEASTNNNCYAFNFDGKKATDFTGVGWGYHTTNGIKSKLQNDINHFENVVFDAKFDIKYRDDLSSSTWTVYSRYNPGKFGMSSFTSYWYFSKDRKTMVHKESSSNNEWTYQLTPKEDFVNEGRRRTR